VPATPEVWRGSIQLGGSQVCARFQATDYDILHQNCNHFTVALCNELTGLPPPTWINRLAFLGVEFPPPHDDLLATRPLLQVVLSGYRKIPIIGPKTTKKNVS
jgi:hypothetical protein